jgi:DNA mismatch repair protein MutS2
VVTTHFDRLKAYGYLHPDVENVAVAFDEKTLDPKYTLLYGVSGLSNAFLVAEKFGISEEVLQLARQHQDGGEREVGRVLERLERLRADTEKERVQLLQTKEEAARERQRLKELLEGIKKKRQEIFSQAEEKARKSVLKVEEELKNWAQRWKEEKSHSTTPRITVPHREIQEVKEKFLPPPREKAREVGTGGIQVGEHVRILSLRTHGVVIEVEASLKQIEVMTEKAKVRTSFSDIVRAAEKEERTDEITKEFPPKKEEEEISSQLNVIGLTVEDALPQVDKFIDQALLHGLEKIQIIHGVGSGRLREAIGKYLHDHQGVKGFSPGDARRGGRGITVVELR